MTERKGRGRSPGGATTGVGGTPVPVDVSRDREARVTWVVFLGGPVIWFAHFMLVYLVAEAGCTGGGPGLRLFDSPVHKVVTFAATAVAAIACLALARWSLRRLQESGGRPGSFDTEDDANADQRFDDRGLLDLASFMLSMVFLVAVLFVGLTPAFLPAC